MLETTTTAPAPKRTAKATLARKAKLAEKTQEQLSAEMSAVRNSLEAHIAAVVDRAPELTPEQIEKLRPLLAGASE